MDVPATAVGVKSSLIILSEVFDRISSSSLSVALPPSLSDTSAVLINDGPCDCR